MSADSDLLESVIDCDRGGDLVFLDSPGKNSEGNWVEYGQSQEQLKGPIQELSATLKEKKNLEWLDQRAVVMGIMR